MTAGDDASAGLAGDHAGDLVSAYVDGELTDGTRQAVADHLERCPECRDMAEDARAAKALLRELPAVDGTSAVGRFVARHRAAVRTGTAFVLATSVALLALAATASVARPAVVPDLEPVLLAHGATDPDLVVGMEPRAELGERYAAPPALLGNRVSLSRREVYRGGGRAMVVYGQDRRAAGSETVTVVEQHGRLDWDALPDGAVTRIGARRVWERPGQPIVLVTEIGHLVVTVVSADRAAAVTVVDGLPEAKRSSTFDRVHDACQRMTEVFALSG